MAKVPLVALKNIESKGEPQPKVAAVVPMREPISVPKTLRRLGDPSRVSVYRKPDGDAVFAVMRWDLKSGEKRTLPVIWDGEEFVNAGYDGARPLYSAELLAHMPMAPVLVVEGEKAADDGQQYLPDGWLMTTWAGGTNAVEKSDWSLLAGRTVIIWPDNDTAGRDAAERIKKILQTHRARVVIIEPPAGLPPKWDLADPLPDTLTAAAITAMIASAENTLPAPPPLSILPDDDEQHVPDGFIDEHLQWKPLGYDKKYYYVMPGATRIVLRMTAKELMSPSGCLQIVNDIDHWSEAFPPRKGSSERADWTLAGASMMKKCTDIGYYDERRILGRGVWNDAGRVVVNTGDALLVDGVYVNPVKMKSRYIYETSESIFSAGFKTNDEATPEECRLVVELCNAPRWEKVVYGDLLAGYIATALVCGALSWRTHIWITGNSGSGKSTVVNAIAEACIGDVAIYPLGQTTESGIRQFIGNDARPVIFDEMEGTDEQNGGSGARRQAIIQLMRMASTESRGTIIKGSAGHSAVSFTMRSSFLFASIGVSLKEAPDLTRTMILSLRPLSQDATEQEKREANEQYAVLNKLAAKLPADMSYRLFARQTRLVPVIRKNAIMFREVLAELLGNRRLGDQVGALLAGRVSLTSESVLTREQCEEFVRGIDWDDVVYSGDEREDKVLIRHIRQSGVRVQSNDGRMIERTIGEMVENVFEDVDDPEVRAVNMARGLLRIGISVDRRAGVAFVSRSHTEIGRIMRTSPNPNDWFSVLSRYPGAAKPRIPVRFAGASATAIAIPKEAWFE